jgi:hypothetical protein
MKKILSNTLSNIYTFLYCIGKARSAAHFAQIGRHDLAREIMMLPR